jgi:valyl-tRNA synthetase
MLFSSPAGNDLLFDEKLCEQGRNFTNKIWNAFRLIKGWELDDSPEPNTTPNIAIAWFRSKLDAVIAETLDHYDKFRMSDALLSTYNLIWNDFCSNYLEMVKPAYIDGQSLPIEVATYRATVVFFDELMRLVHPWTPFITEEIWQNLEIRKDSETICLQPFPTAGKVNNQILADFDVLLELVSWVRNTRQSKQLSPKEALPLAIKTASKARFVAMESLIKKLANISVISYTEAVSGISLVIKADEFGIDLGSNLDIESEIENLEKELIYIIGFRNSVEAKLSNERFVANAKGDIVEREKAKLADAESKIKFIEESLSKLR